MSNPKIVYPSQPAIPSPTSVSAVAGGSLAATTYTIKLTFATMYGESLPSLEFSFACPANQVPVIASPADPGAPTIVTGWNVYMGTAAGAETLQNTSVNAIGTSWTMPTTGLIAGSQPPSTWGTTLAFSKPPRNIPQSDQRAIGDTQYSSAGVRNQITERVDQYLSFKVQFIALGTDANAWQTFLDVVLQGVPFDYYPDASLANYTTYALTNKDARLAWHSPGYYDTELELRQEVPQLSSPPISSTTTSPSNAARWIPFVTSAAGAFVLQHGLSYMPNGVCAPLMTSAGAVWFQSTPFDVMNINLVASDAGLTGMVLVW